MSWPVKTPGECEWIEMALAEAAKVLWLTGQPQTLKVDSDFGELVLTVAYPFGAMRGMSGLIGDAKKAPG